MAKTAQNSLASPNIIQSKRVLRVLGTSVTHFEELRVAAEADLGLKIEFTTLNGTEAQRRGALSPASFDLYDQWFHDIDLIWPTGSLQPINVERIDSWSDIGDLPKTGCLSSGQVTAPGGDPSQKLFVQRNGSLSNIPTHQISMMPTVHNADSFGTIGTGSVDIQSWAAFIDPRWTGKIILQSDAAIGSLDMLMALGASRNINIQDIGNLSLSEIDLLTKKLTEYNGLGQFKAFWADESEAISAFQSDEPVIGSLWWSGAVKLRALGIPVSMATPVEGYRGWFGGIALSRHSKGAVLDMSYDYMNWWLSGLPGALMARNGAYMTNSKAVKLHLSPAEWEFWYEGKAAKTPITDPRGVKIYDVGECRGGGSYYERMSRVAVWDSVMQEHNYLVRCWDNAIA